MSHDATNWAIQQRGLKPTTKIVLWHLCNRHNPDYGCFPSQNRLAYDSEISRSTLNDHLGHLEAEGLLRRVPAFAELPMTAVERVAAGLVPFSAEVGTALMTQHEPGDRFLVIGTGDIEVIVDGTPIHRLGPGAGVGEIALIRRGPRTATVIALTDVTGYSVDASTFLAAVAGPAAAAVTERMAQANLMRSAAAELEPATAR